MKSVYILKRERLEPYLERLQAIYDQHLSLQNEMIQALQRAGDYGSHGAKKKQTDIRETTE